MRNEIKEIIQKLETIEEEAQNLKDSLRNLINNEDFQRFYSPEELKKRKKKEYNQKYYRKHK